MIYQLLKRAYFSTKNEIFYTLSTDFSEDSDYNSPYLLEDIKLTRDSYFFEPNAETQFEFSGKKGEKFTRCLRKFINNYGKINIDLQKCDDVPFVKTRFTDGSFAEHKNYSLEQWYALISDQFKEHTIETTIIIICYFLFVFNLRVQN